MRPSRICHSMCALVKIHIFSPAQKSTYEAKRKNYVLLLRLKLKITKFEDKITKFEDL